jgi:signal transduction histidine kinase
MALHELMDARRGEILNRWMEQVRGTLAPEAMSHLELVDHMPDFLAELLHALRHDHGGAPPVERETPASAVHGEHRLRLGFSLDAVVREYGALIDAIIATARNASHDPSTRELQVLFDFTVGGIARAVSEYTTQRDADLQRQANEHFSFVAHELRNPLSTAMSAFHTLRLLKMLPEDHRAAGALDRGLQRASELVDQSLANARIASGVDLRPVTTTLADLFQLVEGDVAAEADSKGVVIDTTVRDDASVQLDVRLIRSAVDNLLRNGVKHTSAGGSVVLRGGISDGRAVIEVEDGCGGVDPAEVEAAFAPFVRIDPKQPGFGLGLAIARQAVDAHGGTLRVQNLPGKGCVFVLSLPVAERSTQTPATASQIGTA